MKNKFGLLFFALVLSLVILPQVSLAESGGGGGGGGSPICPINLVVTDITAVKISAIANNNFSDGWKWLFTMTVPCGEDKLQMKFLDWTNSGTGVIPAGSNMRYYSAQSLNASTTDSAIMINSANTYADNLILHPTVGGQQVQVAVEVKIPVGTTGGAYSTSYGVQTTGTTTTATTTPQVVASILSSLSPNSPMAGNVAISADQTTDGVVLGVFRLKSIDQASALESLRFRINNSVGVDPSVFSNFYLFDGVNRFNYSPSERIYEGLVDFYSLNIPLPKDIDKDLTFMVDVNRSLSSFSASTTIIANSIEARDANDNLATTSSTVDVTGNNQMFTPWGLTMTMRSFAENVYSFDLTSTENDLFISKSSPSGALACSNSPQAYDTDTAYLIPAGSARRFSLYSAEPLTSITINYGASSSDPTALLLTQDLAL